MIKINFFHKEIIIVTAKKSTVTNIYKYICVHTKNILSNEIKKSAFIRKQHFLLHKENNIKIKCKHIYLIYSKQMQYQPILKRVTRLI